MAVRRGALSETLLGETIDGAVLRHFERAGIDPAGENGEYHTLVVDGPILRQPLSVTFGDRVLRDDMWFLDVEAT